MNATIFAGGVGTGMREQARGVVPLWFSVKLIERFHALSYRWERV
jgi:hypothetical protein